MVIKRKDLQSYLTGDLFEALSFWKEYRRFGLPHGAGLVGETWEYTTLISNFEEEFDFFQADKIKKR